MRRFYFIAVLTLGCALGMGLLTSSETVTAQTPVADATMSGHHLKGGARGAVKTAQGRMVDGLMVQLISEKTAIRTTVYTDEAGRYEFPVLESGEYVLRVPRPLEFRQFTRKGVRIDGPTRLDEIVVHNIGDGTLAPAADFLPPVPELLPQLTGAEWLSNLEGSEQEKAAVLKACSIGCHSVSHAFRMTFDDASWETFLTRMLDFRPRLITSPNEHNYIKSQEGADMVVNFMKRNRGIHSTLPAIRPFPRPSGPATRAVVTEYELPWTTVNIHDVAGDGQGNIWFTINRSPLIGKLDSKTGKVTSYRVPVFQPPANAPIDTEGMAGGDVTKAHPGLQHIWVAKDGMVWFTGTWADGVGRLDPRTGDIQLAMTHLMYPEEGMAATHNLGFAPDGTMYKTGNNKIYQWDPSTVFETGKPSKIWPLKEANRTYGNFVSWDGRYFGGGGSHIVWLDTETGEVRERKLTVGGKGRGAFDPFGNIWVGGDRLAKYDPKADTLSEYRLPTPYTNLYSTRADKNGDVWSGEMQGGRVARFKPKTHQWIEYVLPTPWSLDFNSWIDNSTDVPTFWYGDELGYIVRIQPME
jgi:streptogramin lyase